MNPYPPDQPPRIVTPRKPNSTYRHVIAVTKSELFIERTGVIHGADALPNVLLVEPSSILVCQDLSDHIARLLDWYKNEPTFQYRMTPRESNEWIDVRGHKTIMFTDSVVNFVGFRNSKSHKASATRYHYPLDPIHFCRGSIDELFPDDRPRLFKLLEWAKQIREWCMSQGLEIKPSAGGLAAQLLKDPRFYPNDRRKVPKLINAIAREQLPGNYYRLKGDPDRQYNAIYLDMENAHHAMAKTIAFPDANTLHAYGNWGRDKPTPFADGTSEILSRPGLFHLAITVPAVRSGDFPPPAFERYGENRIWMYSNELSYFQEFDVKIDGVISALVSDDREPRGTGLNHYGEFSIQEIRQNRSARPWLKPTLHASYGLLAARPLPFETGYYRAKGGEPTEYVIGRHSFPVLTKKQAWESESRIANVIHRGMIEAEVRKQALALAKLLTQADGREVLAIYADSVIVRDSGLPLKLLPPPWRIKDTLTNLRFLDATRFVSDEMTRLPGVPRDKRTADYLDRAARRDELLGRWREGEKRRDALTEKPGERRGPGYRVVESRA